MHGTEVVNYNVTDVVIAEMEKAYMGLTIKDLDDTEGFEAVHEARMVVKGKRVEVEKKRKELKADALAWGKTVDTEAKRIFNLLEPVETHLKTEEAKITDEKKRVKEEEERREREKVESRMTSLSGYGKSLPFFDVAAMSEEEYGDAIAKAKDEWDAEQERIAKEEADRKAEAERLEKERAELDKKKAEQEAAQKKIDEENRKIKEAQKAAQKKIDDEKAALEAEKKAVEDKKAREDFEIQAKIDAEKEAAAKVEREAKEAEEKKTAAIAEEARQDALRPDKEKLIAFANSFYPPELPKVKDPKAQEIVNKAEESIFVLSEAIKRDAEAL